MISNKHNVNQPPTWSYSKTFAT